MTSPVVLGSFLELLLPTGLDQRIDVIKYSFSCTKKKIFELTSSSSSHVCNVCGVCNRLTFALSEVVDLVV